MTTILLWLALAVFAATALAPRQGSAAAGTGQCDAPCTFDAQTGETHCPCDSTPRCGGSIGVKKRR